MVLVHHIKDCQLFKKINMVTDSLCQYSWILSILVLGKYNIYCDNHVVKGGVLHTLVSVGLSP